MLCPRCGKELPETERFCPDCGALLAHGTEEPKTSENLPESHSSGIGDTARRFVASVNTSSHSVDSSEPSWMGSSDKTVVVLSAVLLVTMLMPWVSLPFLTDYLSSNPSMSASLQTEYSLWQLVPIAGPYAASQWLALGLPMVSAVLSVTLVVYFVALALLIGGFFFMISSKGHSTVLIGVGFLLCAVVSLTGLCFMFYINDASAFKIAGATTVIAPTVWCILSAVASILGIVFSFLANRGVSTSMN